jgi:hypothetical protein
MLGHFVLEQKRFLDKIPSEDYVPAVIAQGLVYKKIA